MPSANYLTKAGNIPAPPGLSYYPFQREDIVRMLAQPKILVASEPGVGKTIECAGLINADQSIREILVVCPATVKLNWRVELERWLDPPRGVAVVSREWTAGVPIHIVNFDRLRAHREAIRSECEFYDLLVIDESSAIKNYSAGRTREIIGKRKRVDGQWAWDITPIRARRILELNGTPIENRPEELAPQLEAIGALRSIAGTRENFYRRYCSAHFREVYIAGGRGEKRRVWDTSGASRLEELSQKLLPFMVRRTRAEVLPDLPPKIRRVVDLENTPETRKLVAAEEKLFGRLFPDPEEAEEIWRENFLNLDDGDETRGAELGEFARVRQELGRLKLQMAIPYLEQVMEEEAKVVIFAHHRSVIAQARAWANAALGDKGAVSITGETPQQERQEAVERFQGDERCRLFLGNIRAAGRGITLTAASRAVFLELTFVPSELTQAEDRLCRIGQQKAVLVEHLVLDGSLDARMARALIRKQEIADRVVDGTRWNRAYAGSGNL